MPQAVRMAQAVSNRSLVRKTQAGSKQLKKMRDRQRLIDELGWFVVIGPEEILKTEMARHYKREPG